MAADQVEAAGEPRTEGEQICTVEVEARTHVGRLAVRGSARVSQQLFGDVHSQDRLAEASKPQRLCAWPQPASRARSGLPEAAGQILLELAAHKLLANRITDRAEIAPPDRQTAGNTRCPDRLLPQPLTLQARFLNATRGPGPDPPARQVPASRWPSSGAPRRVG